MGLGQEDGHGWADPYTPADALLALAHQGIADLVQRQKQALGIA